MNNHRNIFWFTLAIFILAGIGLPLYLGVKDFLTIALIVTCICWIYAVVFFAYVFFIEVPAKRKSPKMPKKVTYIYMSMKDQSKQWMN